MLVYAIIGIVIGYLIGVKFVQSKNYIYHGPDSNEVKKKIFYWSKNGKYYRFIPVPYVCPPMYINALKQKPLQERKEQQQQQHVSTDLPSPMKHKEYI